MKSGAPAPSPAFRRLATPRRRGAGAPLRGGEISDAAFWKVLACPPSGDLRLCAGEAPALHYFDSVRSISSMTVSAACPLIGASGGNVMLGSLTPHCARIFD